MSGEPSSLTTHFSSPTTHYPLPTTHYLMTNSRRDTTGNCPVRETLISSEYRPGFICTRSRMSDRGSTETPPIRATDRKSKRLNSSHHVTSYAGFCLQQNIEA